MEKRPYSLDLKLIITAIFSLITDETDLGRGSLVGDTWVVCLTETYLFDIENVNICILIPKG